MTRNHRRDAGVAAVLVGLAAAAGSLAGGAWLGTLLLTASERGDELVPLLVVGGTLLLLLSLAVGWLVWRLVSRGR